MANLRLLFKHETIALAPNALNSDSSSATVILKLMCQSLVRIDHDGKLQPDLATHFEISPCRRRYTFWLDPLVSFHDGSPCTAHDVVRIFRQIFDGRSDSILDQDYAGFADVRAAGSHRIVFDFDHPNDAFLYNLAWRTHIVADTAEQPCGTGPFKLQQWRRGSHIAMARHVDERKPAGGNVESLRIEYAPEITDRIARIERRDVDIIESVPGSAAVRLEAEGLLETMVAPSQARVLLCFNCRRLPFSNRKVRLAVAHAVNRDALIHDVMGGEARGGEGLLPHDDPWAHPVAPIAHDPVRARALLSEAGYGDGLEISVAHPTTAPLSDVKSQIAQDLAAVGIKLTAMAYDDPPWWPYVYTHGRWDMAIQGTASRPHLDTMLRREFCSDGAFNAGQYSNPDLDDLARQARHSIDTDERRRLYAEIQEILRADLPVVSLFASNVVVGWRPGVTGMRAHPHGLIDVQNVRIPGNP